MPNIQFQFRRGTAAEWQLANPILAQGEMGIETDTDLFKIGDGVTNWNSLGYGGVQGIQGIQGPQGTQGVQGTQGIQGDLGIQGTQGIQGPQGTQGTQGVQGTQGIQGDRGLQGIQGIQGPQGVQGTQGIQGNLGIQGTQGVQGAQGPQGTQGIQGNLGIQGTQGVQGLQGPQGTTGIQGAQGIQGIQGNDGNFGGASFYYYFDTQTFTESIGSGYILLSNTNLDDANVLAIHLTDRNSSNVESFMQTIDDSTSSIKGTVKITEEANTLNFAIFIITGNHTDHGDHIDVPVAYINGVTTPFPDNSNVVVSFLVTGDKGDQGIQGIQGPQGTTGSQGTQGVQGTLGPQGTIGIAGAPGADSIIYTFDNSTTDSNPTVGFARLNNSDRTLVTQAYVSKTSNAGANSVPWLNSLVASTNSPNKSIITFGRTNDFAYNYARYYVTGLTDATGYVKLALTYIDHIGTLNTNGANLLLGASRIGDVGSQGIQGTQGAQGFEGLQGIQGFDGIQGLQGFEGLQGLQGPEGAQGIDGSQGVQGTQGLTGSQGTQGLQGAQGTTGSQGTQGLQGFTGSQGIQGLVGTGSQGIQGIQGPAGGGGGGAAITVKDEGTTLTTSLQSIDFVGATVQATSSGGDVTVTITGGVQGIQGIQGISGGGGIADSYETVNKNLGAYDAAFAYSSGSLQTITYTWSTNSIVKTFNYTSGKLTSIVLSGDTPGGIELTKTFGYTGDDLTSITYT